MNLTTIVSAIAAIAVAYAIGGVMGYRYNEANHSRAEVKVLQSDAKVLPAIEAKDAKERTRIVTVIKTIKEQSKPEDCLNQPMPRNVIDQLPKPGSS